MGKLVKKDGKFLKKNGKFVKTDNIAECSCCGDGPCPPGKYCTWIPPDPCSTGKCRPDRIDDNPFLESQCGDAPYDCRSEDACNQWYEKNPNPPCDCWFCESGELVNRPAYTNDCIGRGGNPNKEDVEADCLEECKCFPPPSITSLRLEKRDDPNGGGQLLCVIIETDWSPPDGCFDDSADSRSKASLEIEFLNKDGAVVKGAGGAADLGPQLFELCGPLSVACDLANKDRQVSSARARILDSSNNCPPSKWEEKGLDAGSDDYDGLCPPPIRYICVQPYCDAGKNYCNWRVVINGGVPSWEGGFQDCRNVGCPPGLGCQYPSIPATIDGPQATLTDCVGQSKFCMRETDFNPDIWEIVSGPYDTSKECEAACNPPPPPDKECCVECDSGAYPETCDGCPDGYDCIEAGGAIFCIKSTPVACGFEENGDYLQDTLDAIKDCEQMGGAPMATQAPCREPPPPTCEGQKVCDEWQADYDADGNFVTCVRVCCEYNADCGCIDGSAQPEFSPDQSLCPAVKENPLP